MSRYYTPIDGFFNKFRRKGFLIYTSIVVAATLYTFYSISNLPDVKELEELEELRKKKKEAEEAKKLKREEREKEKGKDKKVAKPANSEGLVTEQLRKDHNEIDNWSRKELHSYLSKHKTYADVDVSREELVEQVKALYYENSVAHFI